MPKETNGDEFIMRTSDFIPHSDVVHVTCNTNMDSPMTCKKEKFYELQTTWTGFRLQWAIINTIVGSQVAISKSCTN